MPIIDAGGCPIHVEIEGSRGAPVLILSNSLGTTLHMWGPQLPELTRRFQVVRFDRRGHGRSGVPPGPFTMERLGRDVLAIMNSLDIDRASWCGLSMGGMEGMWLGANAANRFDRIVLANTSSYFADKAAWNERLRLVREKGLAAFSTANMERWFTKDFRERAPQTIAWMKEMFSATPLEGYIACAEAVRDMDHRKLLAQIKAPTLVIIGRHDPATTPEAGEFVRSHIPGAGSTLLDAAHLSNIEQPREFTDAVLRFLNGARN